MITVIKPGRIRGYEVTCKRCGCVFRFEDSDIEKNAPYYDNTVKVKCPHCYTYLASWSINSLVNSYS